MYIQFAIVLATLLARAEVMAQASQINLNFKLKEPAPVARSVTKISNNICNNFPDKSKYWAINDGADYLRNLPGQPTNGPGPALKTLSPDALASWAVKAWFVARTLDWEIGTLLFVALLVKVFVAHHLGKVESFNQTSPATDYE
ncbi:uncharacterized protein K460DRAFT_352208 [Cucurbitaria berberidis CBS 394.84]|uniref:Uncharacterized protein n=1 Tax=Cucurbitaria berberidis CBS 394.84 TaxID=1168544 RepID=A0A9P4GK35_9PLEO|nr:uncharacterized protein K460DRAFT_352208 [Cucurbitaria berberidis CBS 394.84]KAF1847020.1 hypothetical protein K460DRAFT_352208 [Cucurbitaria berberidis CBS 394.84]